MAQILLKSASFVFIIAFAYFLKRLGLFGPSDYKIAIKLVLNVTMPAAVITSFAAYKADFSLLVCTALGFAMNWLLLGIAWLISKRFGRSSRALWLNCTSGYNIGTFVLPFVQSFLSPAGVVGCCLFDAGSATMCTGGTYALSCGILGDRGSFTLKEIGKRLIKSVPFDFYVIMLILTLLGITIPAPVINFISPIANANAFLAMFMIGLMFDPNIKKEMFKEVASILAVRVGVAMAAALGFYFLLPLDQEVRKALAMAVFAPISIASTAFSEKTGADPSEAGCLNSLSILASIVCIVTLATIFSAA